MTAAALKGDQEKCLAAGCTALYLTKPIKQDVLLSAIQGVFPLEPARSSIAEGGRRNTIQVRTNAKSAERIAVFLENGRRNVVAIRDALDRSDFPRLSSSWATACRGSGGMFGFQGITDIGAALELAAESGDADASRVWVGELSQYLDRVEVVSE